jgi:hypothetical protein
MLLSPSLLTVVQLHRAAPEPDTAQQSTSHHESDVRGTHGGRSDDSHCGLYHGPKVHRGAAHQAAEAKLTMAPFALDVRYGAR